MIDPVLTPIAVFAARMNERRTSLNTGRIADPETKAVLHSYAGTSGALERLVRDTDTGDTARTRWEPHWIVEPKQRSSTRA